MEIIGSPSCGDLNCYFPGMKKHCPAMRTWRFHCFGSQAFGAKNYDPRKLKH